MICRSMKYFAVVQGDTGRVVAFDESEREHYALKYAGSIVGVEYPSYEIAARAVELGLKGWRMPKLTAPAKPPIPTSDQHH
jgi:hypothetical protein